MKLKLICLLVIIGVTSCKREVNKDDKVKEKNFLFFKASNEEGNIKMQKNFSYKISLKKDSIKIFKEKYLVNNFIYKVDNKGIYIWNNDKYTLLYPFELNASLDRDKDLTNMFYRNVKLKRKKTYSFKEKETTLYHFIENGFDGSLDSYYMEGEGFICFYKYNDDDFLYLNSPKALEISKVFLNDSTFFAKLILENR